MTEEDRADFRSLQLELLDILHKENKKRTAFLDGLEAAIANDNGLSAEEREVYDGVYDSIRRSAKELEAEFRRLRRELRTDPTAIDDLSARFNYSGVRVAPAVRRSVYLRTALLRHTPTLQGRPVSPHPEQMYPFSGRRESVTVDYLRASCLFDLAGSADGTERKAHPTIDRHARDVANTVYGTQPGTSFAFNGATGGIKTARDLMEAECFGSARRIFLHDRSWMEITADVEWTGSGVYEFTEATGATELRQILQREGTCGLIVEPILNHEEMERMAVGGLLNELGRLNRFEEPTYLLVDAVHLPEFDPFSRIGEELPENLCLMSVVSTVKYLQAGWDLTKGGVLSVSVDAESFDGAPIKRLLKARENNGTGISYEEAALMTIETPDSFRSRIDRYDRNVELLFEALSEAVRNTPLELGYTRGSRLIYIHTAAAESARLHELHESLIQRALEEGIPLMDASSYGMNSPHLHLGVATEGSVVRISPGSTNYSTVRALADIVREVAE